MEIKIRVIYLSKVGFTELFLFLFCFVLTQSHGAASQDGPQKEHSGELEAGTYSKRYALEMLLTASRHPAEADISVK